MTITKHLESISFSSLTLPDLLELPKGKWKRKLQTQQYPLRRSHTPSSSSFISTIDIFHTTYIHPIILLAIKVFAFSIIYHLVEEKTSKSIQGFNYSWYITFFELSCAFLLEFIERISIAYNTISTDSSLSNLAIIDEEAQSLLPTNTGTEQPTDYNEDISSSSSKNEMNSCKRLLLAIKSIFNCDIFRWSYVFLAFNLIFSRGLATIVLQYYDMDYPTYAICRNSKMVFVMFLSVVWLKKSYHCTDWILVLLTSISVLCFRLASHDLWFSSANTMGVPLLLVSTFLSAMDNSWKEKVTIGNKNVSANEILFNINLVAITILFIWLTVFSSEYMDATIFLFSNPSALIWMILRGISYSLWIHFSVVLIQQAGALINQYVSASRKLFSVILSFIMFGRPFYFMHGVGFIFFAFACLLKISMAQNKAHKPSKSSLNPTLNQGNNITDNNTINTKASDTDDDMETDTNTKSSKEDIIEEFRAFPIPNSIATTVQQTIINRKGIKLDTITKLDDMKDMETSLTLDESSGSYEEKKYDGYTITNNNTNTNTTYKIPILVQ